MIFINLHNILRLFDITKTKKRDTPREPNFYPEKGDNFIDKKLYQRIVGILNYISETVRPDISFITIRLSTFTQCPSYSNLVSAKKVLKYLSQTTKYGVFFKRRVEGMYIDVHSDSSWKNVPGDRSSIDGHIIFLNEAAVFWKSKKQSIIARSSTEAKVVGISGALSSMVWLLKILDFLEIKEWKLKVYMDSMSAIKLLQGKTHSDKNRHMELKYFS
eukprot:snap_masked-scaffold_88-processed-gene-0.29-mRNA-1 protein AED:1.00 eAED:1.00 QI:0/0/0/0/1/1/2/0/216